MLFALYLAANCCVSLAPAIRQTQTYPTYAACEVAGASWVKTFPLARRSGQNYACWPEKP